MREQNGDPERRNPRRATLVYKCMGVETFAQVLVAAQKARRAGKTIVATNGCFDIVHVGHIRNLEAAKRLGGVLIVGVNSDASVRANKGKSRPIVPARERAELIASLKPVDHVFIFSGRTPFTWIKKLKPDIHVKGGGRDVIDHPDFAEQRRVVARGGGKVVVVPHHKGRSTSRIIEKIKQA